MRESKVFANISIRWTLIAVSLGAVALLTAIEVATATGSTSRAAAGVQEAKRLVAAAEKPVKWSPPGGDFNATKAKGKVVGFLSPVVSIPFVQNQIKGIRDGLAAVGAKEVICDPKGLVSEEA